MIGLESHSGDLISLDPFFSSSTTILFSTRTSTFWLSTANEFNYSQVRDIHTLWTILFCSIDHEPVYLSTFRCVQTLNYVMLVGVPYINIAVPHI